MKSISVKVNNQNATIGQAQVITKDGEPTVIKATKNVNYELANDATGFAPDHIVTKRQGKDLHVSFEEDGEEADLIIEGFYDSGDSALIGLAEDGSYYYYVPDTGSMTDYVTELAQGDIEGQALGGNAYADAWWLGASESTHSVFPWLVGLAGLVGAGMILKDNDKTVPVTPAQPSEKPLVISELSSQNLAKDGTIVGKVLLADNTTPATGSTVQVTLPNNAGVVTATVGANGSFKTDPLSDAQKTALIQGGTITALALPTAPELLSKGATQSAPKTADVIGAPQIDTTDAGGVVITPSEQATQITVKYTQEETGLPKTATLTKTGNTWKADTGEIIINPNGTMTIGASQIKDNEKVSASQQNSTQSSVVNDSVAGVNNISMPTVNTDVDGNATVVPTKTADKVEVTFTNEAGKAVSVTATKDKDGNWTAPNAPQGVTVDKNGTVSIPASQVQDGSVVEAKQATVDGTSSQTARVLDSLPEPSVIANADGSATITPNSKATKSVVNYTDETGNPVELVAVNNKGSWTLTNPPQGVIIESATGKITVPAKQLKDGATVSATNDVMVTDPLTNKEVTKTSSPAIKTVANNIPEPTIDAPQEGDVVVTPSSTAVKTTVSYTDQTTGQPVSVTATKTGNTWVLTTPPKGVTIDQATGKVTITSQIVKDKTPVSASNDVQVETNGQSNTVSSDKVVVNSGSDIPAPKIDAKPDGSISVMPSSPNATQVNTSYTDDNGKPVSITATKQPNGEWTAQNIPQGVVFDKKTGGISVPANKVNDGSTVTATEKTPSGDSLPATETAGTDIARPEITANPTNGEITVKPSSDDATGVNIAYTDKAGKPQTINATKDKNGNWTATDSLGKPVDNNPNADGATIDSKTGKVSLPADNTKAGTEVVANQTTPAGSGEKDKAVVPAIEKSKSAKPTDVAVINKDSDNDGDHDETIVTAKVPVGGSVEVTVAGKIVPADKVVVDNAGNLTVTLNPALPTDTPIQILVKEPGKDSSEPVLTKSPALDDTPRTNDPSVDVANKDTDGNGADDKTTISGKAEPNAEVTVTTPNGEQKVTAGPDGNYSVDVPVLKDGDKVSVTAKAPNKDASDPVVGNVPAVDGTPKTNDPSVDVANKDTDGNGADDKTTISGKAEPNAEVTVTTPNGEQKVTAGPDGNYSVDVPVLKDGDKVSVTAKAPNKDASDPVVGNVPAVDGTPKTNDPSVDVANKDTDGNGADDKTTISGKAEPNAEVTVTTPNGEQKVTAGPDGNYSVDVPVLKDGDKVSVTAKAPNKDASDPVVGNVPAVDGTPKTNDPSVDVANKDTDGNGADDKTTISGKAEPNAEVTVTTPNGEQKVTAGPDGNYSVDVPVLKDGDKVSVTAKAPNKDASDPVVGNVPAVDGTPKTNDPSVDVANKDTDGNGADDKTTISGKAEPNAEVTVTTPNGEQKVTAGPDGNYSVDVPVLKDGDKVSVTAKAPNKDASDPVVGNVPAVDGTPKTNDPSVDVANKDTDGNGADDKTTISGKAEPNAEVTVTTPNGEQKVTAGPDGNYSVDVPVLKDGDKVSVTAKAPNKDASDPVVGNVPAVDGTPKTNDPSVDVANKDTDGNGADDKTTISGKAEPNAEVTVTTPNGEQKVTAGPDGNYSVDVPVLKDGDKVSVTAKAPNKDASDPVVGNVPAVDGTPKTNDPSVDVANKDTDGNGADDKTTISGKAEPNAEVTVTTPNGEQKVTAGPDGNYSVDVPVLKDGDKVSVTAKAPNKDASDPVVGNVPAVDGTPKTNDPSVDVANKDTDGNGADDKTTISGKAEPNAEVTVTTPNGEQKVTAGPDGNYSVDVPVLKDGDKVSVTAKAPNKDASDPVVGNVPAVDGTPKTNDPSVDVANKDTDGNGADDKTTISGKAEPNAEVTVTTPNGEQKVTAGPDGNYSVDVPVLKDGDKVSVTAKAPNKDASDPVVGNVPAVDGTPKTNDPSVDVANKDTDGNGADDKTTISGKAEPNAEVTVTTPNGEQKVTAGPDGNYSVDVPVLKDGDKVSVTAKAPNKDASDPVVGNVPAVDGTPKTNDPSVDVANKDTDGNGADDKTTISGKAEPNAEVTVTTPNGEQKVTAGPDGNYSVDVPVLKDGDKVSVTAKAPNKDASDPVVGNVPAVDGTPKTNDPSVDVANKDTDGNGADDKTTISGKAEPNAEVTVTTPNGEQKVTAGPDGNYSVDVPVLKDGDKVSVTAKAPNKDASDPVVGNVPAVDGTPKTNDPSVDVANKDTDGNGADDKTTISGKAEPNAEVTVTTPNGEQKVTAGPDGNYSVDVPVLKDGDKVSVTAKAPNKDASDPVVGNVPAVDGTPKTNDPSVDVANKDTDGNGADDKTTISGKAEPNAEVTVTTPNGEQKVTAGPDGNYSVDVPVLKDGDKVSVTAKAPNKDASDPVVGNVPAVDGTPKTNDPSVDVANKDTDGNGADDKTTISGKAEPNAEVTVTTPNGEQKVTAGPDGNYSVDVPVLKDGDKVSVTAKAPNKDASDPVVGNVPAVDGTPKTNDPSVDVANKDTDGNGADDKTTISGKAEPNAEVTVTTPNGEQKVTAGPDGNYSVDVPVLKDGDKVSVTAKAPNKDASDPVVGNVPAVDGTPKTNDPSVDVANKDTDGNGADDKTTISGKAEPNAEVTVTTPNGEQKVTAGPDGNYSVDVPVLKDGDKVSVTAKAPNKDASDPVVGNVPAVDGTPKTNDPSVDVANKDTDGNGADDKTTISGKAEPNAEVTVTTPNGEQKVTAGPDGNYSVDVPVLKDGDKVSVTAKAPNKDASDPVVGNVPAVDGTPKTNDPSVDVANKDTDGNGADDKTTISGKAEPNAEVTVTTPNGEQKVTAGPDGNYSVDVPVLKDGDKVSVTAKAPNKDASDPVVGNVPAVDGTPKTNDPSVDVANKDTDGNGADDKTTISGKAEPNAEVTVTTPNGEQKVTAGPDGNYSVDVPVLKDGDKVSVTAKAPNKDASDPVVGNVPAVDGTPKTNDPSVDVANKDTDGNGADDKTTISGKAEPNAEVTVTTPNGEQKVTAGPDGNYSVDVPVLKDGDKVSVTAKAPNKDASDPVVGNVPAVDGTPKTNDPSVDVANKDTDGNGADDKTTISGKAEPNAEVTVTTPNGEQKVTAGPDGNYSVDVPVLKDGDKVSVTAKAPNKDASDPVVGNVPAVDGTPKTNDPSVDVANKDTDGNGADDKTTISGKAEPNAEVTVTTPNGEQKVTAGPDGNYSVDVPVLKDGDKVSVTAKAPNKDASDPVVGNVPAVDGTPKTNDPSVDVANKDTDGNGADDKTTISGKAEPNAEVTVTTPNGEQKVTAGPDGNYSVDVPVLKDGDKVSVTAKAPNKDASDPVVGNVPAVDGTPKTNDPSVDVANKDTDGNGADDKTTISGKAEPNAEVTVTTPNGEQKVTAGPDGNYSVDVPVLKDGDKVSVTAKAPNKDASDPVVGNVPAVDGTPKTNDPSVDVANKDTDGNGADDKTTISGKAEPNAEVTVTTPNGEQKVTAGPDGNYSVDVPVLKDGDKVSVTAKAPNKDASDPVVGNVPAVDGTLLPTLSIQNVEVTEKTSEQATEITFTVTREGDVSSSSSAKWAFKHGTTDENDFVDLTQAGMVEFAANEKTKQVTFKVNADSQLELDENFTVELSEPTGATLVENQATATGKIINDDAPPTPVIRLEVSGEQTEGGKVTHVVTRDDSTLTSTVTWAVSFSGLEEGAKKATLADFVGDKSGTLTFLPGETRKEIELQLADNALVDGNRQYTIGMVRPTNATIATSGSATIVDNDKLPVENLVASIKVTGDGKTMTFGNSSDDAQTIQVPTTTEDNKTNTGLTYTVELSRESTANTVVTVNLSGGITSEDIKSITGKGVVYDKAKNTVTLTIDAGQTTGSFLLDPVNETVTNKFNYEGIEASIATIANITNTAEPQDKLIINNDNKTAVGAVVDSTPLSLPNLDGDLTLHYGVEKTKLPNDTGYTVSTNKNGQPILTTDGNDVLNIGYFPNGKPSTGAGNLANSLDGGPANNFADNSASITTVDMGEGDDTLTVRGNQTQATRVYLGGGDDTYTVGKDVFAAANNPLTAAEIFAEDGDDTVTIGGNLSQANVYMGSGSDNLTIKGNLTTTTKIDLGSGNMPATYLENYVSNKRPLGSDRVGDKDTDVNSVTIDGSLGGNYSIVGGAGKDTVKLNTYNQTLSLDKVTGIDVIDLNTQSSTGNTKQKEGANTLNNVNSESVKQNNNAYVKGNDKDTVNIDKAFSKKGQTDKDGVKYDTWADDKGNTIHIQQGVSVKGGKPTAPTATPQPVVDGNPATPNEQERQQGVVGKLYESALPNGSKTQNGTAIATGVIDTQNLQAGQKLQLVAPTDKVTSGGQTVNWALSPDKQTLTGTAGGKDIAVIKLSNTGGTYSYTAELKGAIDHLGTNGEALLAKPKVQVVNAKGQKVADTTETELILKVVDDKPVANNGTPQVKPIYLGDSAPPSAGVDKATFGYNQESLNASRSLIPEGNKVSWGSGTRGPASLELSNPEKVSVTDANLGFNFGSITHANNPTAVKSTTFPNDGLKVDVSFTVNIDGKNETEVNSFITLYVAEVAGFADDMLIIKNRTETIDIGGEQYRLVIGGSEADSLTLEQVQQNMQRVSRGIRPNVDVTGADGSVTAINTRESSSNKLELKARLVPVSEGAIKLFEGKAITGTADVSADGTDNGDWTFTSASDKYAVTEKGNTNVFEVKKDSQLVGTFTGKADGKYEFKAEKGAKELVKDSDVINFGFNYGDKDGDRQTIAVKFDLKPSTSPKPLIGGHTDDLVGLFGADDVVDLSAVPTHSLDNVTLANLQQTNTNGLYIKGELGHSVTLGTLIETNQATQTDSTGGVWVKQDTTQKQGDTTVYDTWTNGGINLYIDQDITIL